MIPLYFLDGDGHGGRGWTILEASREVIGKSMHIKSFGIKNNTRLRLGLLLMGFIEETEPVVRLVILNLDGFASEELVADSFEIREPLLDVDIRV